MAVETGKELFNQPEAFDHLTPGQQKHLTDWISNNFQPTKTFNLRHTSYGLKHIFERNGGFYIGNGVFKGAMLKCGFQVKDKAELNWRFNISQKSKAFQQDRN